MIITNLLQVKEVVKKAMIAGMRAFSILLRYSSSPSGEGVTNDVQGDTRVSLMIPLIRKKMSNERKRLRRMSDWFFVLAAY